MATFREILETIDSERSKSGIENTLKNAPSHLNGIDAVDDMISDVNDGYDSMAYAAPEVLKLFDADLKHKIRNVLVAMEQATIDHWDDEFIKITGPRIFEPLLKMLQ